MHERDRRWQQFYDKTARSYDWQLRAFSLLLGAWEPRERWTLVDRLNLGSGQSVLEVGVGTGSNLRFVAQSAGKDGTIVGLDLSAGMLRYCAGRLARNRLRAELVLGEAAHLPFADGAFDAVLHYGGINEFGDKKRAVEEMLRVVKPGGRIVISDEGLPPAKRKTLRNRLLLRFNPLFAHEPPLEVLPADLEEVRQDWFWGQAFWLIEGRKPT